MSHLADALHFRRLLGLHGADEDRVHARFADQLKVRDEALELSQDGERASEFHVSINPDAAFGQSQVSKHFFEAQRAHQVVVAVGFFQQLVERIGAKRFGLHARFGGFVAFHVVVEQDRRFAALLDERRPADVSAAREVIHGRVVLGAAQHEQGIQVAGLHEGIQV